MVQAVGDADRIITEMRLRAQVDGAVIATFDGDVGIAERDRAQRLRGAIGGGGHIGLCAHISSVSLWRFCDRESRESGAWLPCRSAPRSPSAIPSTGRPADWPPRSSAT